MLCHTVHSRQSGLLIRLVCMSQMAKVGVALVEGRTGDAPAGPAAATTESPAASGPVDPARAAAGAAPAAAASPGGSQADILAVKPQAFKYLIGRGHPEFSSNRQQVWHQPVFDKHYFPADHHCHSCSHIGPTDEHLSRRANS
jgi:hypothetical protein